MPYKNKNKVNLKNAYYHAYNRGLKMKTTFYSKGDYLSFIELITTQSEIFDIEILAFCLMPNHYHFLIKQKEKGEMGKFFQNLNSKYARRFNEKYREKGQMWEGTYCANIIKTRNEIENIIHYIHQNPIDIVGNTKDYPYSSYADYLGAKYYKFIKRVRP